MLTPRQLKDTRLKPNEPPTSVYVIMRVFQLEQASIGVKLFVDPHGLQQRGELRFTADKYTVWQRHRYGDDFNSDPEPDDGMEELTRMFTRLSPAPSPRLTPVLPVR